MRRSFSAAAAVTGLAAALLLPPPAHAEVELLSTGTPGQVALLNFDGGREGAPTDRTDVAQASVECDHDARGGMAVFAGALAWAADQHVGPGDDWQYVRVVAGAVDDEGRVLRGQVSPYYPAYDDRPAALPAVSVMLPRNGTTYTPVLMVQFVDPTYRPVGTAIVGSQAGAWMVNIRTPPYGDYWYVAGADLVRCG